MYKISTCFAVPVLLCAVSVWVSGAGSTEQNVSGLYEEVLVTGGRNAISTLSGSATFIDDQQIAEFSTTSLNSLLGRVPGVYIREEDGFGLRPNIGLRGATADRSAKITLMEDGVLISPAPYSAPAAYYVPNVNRMNAVEVFKGPSSIQHGPHTVGGAINLVTLPVPSHRSGKLSAHLGTDGFEKYQASYGDSFRNGGFLVDALRYSSDGFKKLDNGGDTGFERNDLNAKFLWHNDNGAKRSHKVELKLAYADENSDETYLGISDADFAMTADRRYIASALDKFESEHMQIHLTHALEFNNGLQLLSQFYYNRFDRAWLKFDGFLDGPDPRAVLADTTSEYYAPWFALLRGDEDTLDSEAILLSNNDREYGSQGIGTRLSYEWMDDHTLRAGLRYHHDYVERNHEVFSYRVLNGQLQADGINRDNNALNKAEADALALFINDEWSLGDWIINMGLRYEYIDGDFDNQLNGTRSSNSQRVLMPGVGLFWQWTPALGLLAGVNKGFSPRSPAAGSIDPEESINYEYGLRYQKGALQVELIGFFSDYDNYLGRCRASDSGCEVGEEFEGGAAEIAGMEFMLNWEHTFANDIRIPLQAVYTYTESAFQTSFISGFSQWGNVTQGYELPYTPAHRARLQLGLARDAWQVNMALNYSGEMREVPGEGSKVAGEFTEALLTLDLAAHYLLTQKWELSLVAENLADEREIVSRRPYGARPNQPRMVKLGVVYRF